MGAVAIVIAAAAAVTAATTIYSVETQRRLANEAQDAAQRQADEARRIQEDQLKLAQQKADEERQRLEEERKKQEEIEAPWREAKKTALEKYQKMMENPELSDWAKLRIKEEEERIDKSLAAKGLLQSGLAEQLKSEARQRILASEAEAARQAYHSILSSARPEEPDVRPVEFYENYIRSLIPERPQYTSYYAPILETKSQAARGLGQGLAGAITGGLQSYLTYEGYRQGLRGISAPTSYGYSGLGGYSNYYLDYPGRSYLNY